MRKSLFIISIILIFGGCTAIIDDIKETSLETYRNIGEAGWCVGNPNTPLCRELSECRDTKAFNYFDKCNISLLNRDDNGTIWIVTCKDKNQYR